MSGAPLIEVRNLEVHFAVRRRQLGTAKPWLRAVDGVKCEIAPGETLCMVGESGCGKTTLGRAVIRLIDPANGTIIFERKDITRLRGSALRSQRRGFQIIFQDPYGSFDPRLTVQDLIGEALDIHRLAS